MFVFAAAKKQASLSGQLISVSSPHHTETLVLVTSHNTTNENQTMTKTVCFKNNCPNQVIWHECTHCTTNFCHECSQLMNGFRIWMCGSFRSFSQMFCTFVLVDCMTECTLMCCCCECLFVCLCSSSEATLRVQLVWVWSQHTETAAVTTQTMKIGQWQEPVLSETIQSCHLTWGHTLQTKLLSWMCLTSELVQKLIQVFIPPIGITAHLTGWWKCQKSDNRKFLQETIEWNCLHDCTHQNVLLPWMCVTCLSSFLEAASSVQPTHLDHSPLKQWWNSWHWNSDNNRFHQKLLTEIFAWLHTPKLSLPWMHITCGAVEKLLQVFNSLFWITSHWNSGEKTNTKNEKTTDFIRFNQTKLNAWPHTSKCQLVVNAHHLWSSLEAASSVQPPHLDHSTLKQWWKNMDTENQTTTDLIRKNSMKLFAWLHTPKHSFFVNVCHLWSSLKAASSVQPTHLDHITPTQWWKCECQKSDNSRFHQKPFNEIVCMTLHTQKIICCEHASHLEWLRSYYKHSSNLFETRTTEMVVKMQSPKIRQQQILPWQNKMSLFCMTAHTKMSFHCEWMFCFCCGIHLLGTARAQHQRCCWKCTPSANENTGTTNCASKNWPMQAFMNVNKQMLLKWKCMLLGEWIATWFNCQSATSIASANDWCQNDVHN